MRFDNPPAFVPHPWIRSPHLQTFLGYHLPSRGRKLGASRCCLELPDGEQLWLHDDRPSAWCEADRVALMVPGMGGASSSPYTVRIARRLNQRGIRTFRMDQRGCGDSTQLTSTLSHAGRSDDVLAAIRKVSLLCPQALIAVLGFSMGGNMVLKALGEIGDLLSAAVDRCFVVAPPIDLARCVATSHASYSRWLARYIWRTLQDRPAIRRQLYSCDLHPPVSVWDLDARVTAPLSGFASIDEYYRLSSSLHVLPDIRVPTRILAARDDPVITCTIFDEARLSPTTRLLIIQHGGHIGYLNQPRNDADMRWLDWRIVEWLEAPGG